LTISVWDNDNLSVGSLFSIYNSNESYGKWILVDSSGNALLPQIGSIHAAGMNCVQFADSLKKEFSFLLVNPIIVVKVLNREVTVLGEVKSPGNYNIEKEKNLMYELVGKAEGVTPYADLKAVQLVRNDTLYLLNLKKGKDALINIEAGDLLVFPSKKGKIIDQKAPTIIPFASAFTAFAVLLSVFQK
jgi:polysaccharide export outer membrane protein